MAQSEIEWPYTNMTGQNAVDRTEGVFRFTANAEWKIVPNETGRRKDNIVNPFRFLLTPWRPPKLDHDTKFSIVGSIHRNVFEIRSSGATSCHVKMTDSVTKAIYADFDLPSTSEDEFAAALERIGEAKIERPYFDNDRSPHRENVSWDGVTTRVTFERK